MKQKTKNFSEKAQPSETKRGAFVFKDRSGKVHSMGNKSKLDEPAPQERKSKLLEKIVPRKLDRTEGKPTKHGRAERQPEGRPEKRFEKKFEKKRFGKKRSEKDFDRKPDRKFDKKFDKKSKRDRHTPQRSGVDFSNYTKLKATIDKNRKGFGFIIFENREYEDAFLNPREAERFFHGDRVEASVDDDGQIMDLKVIAHRFREVVGRFFPAGKNGMVVYERKKAREEIPVQGSTLGAKPRDWVRAKMHFDADGFEQSSAEILQVYGQELPPSADIQMVSAEYNLIEEHSAEAVKEAESFTLDLTDPERTDLRHIPFITIDGETARDFDDAIYVERNRDGHTLWVAIADVSHYVTEGTHLDQDAFSRGTSVYFPERAFHMLPRALSENLCSLKPNEPRLTMVSKLEYDKAGKRKSVEVMNALIFSQRRATYNEIQKEWEENGSNRSWVYAPHFELYQKIRKNRAARGSIDFDLPEAELKVEPTGEPISIKNRPRLDAHRLIEEFMIAANEAVTDYALERKWPFIYRVHDEPTFKALDKFQELCAHSGVNFVLKRENIAHSLSELILSLNGNPSQTVLNMALLRSMAQAQYSSVYGTHFGLASKGYTHFTSPIRRYPDLIVHRMLKLLLKYEKKKEKLTEHDREEIQEKLNETAEHCSYRERIASDAERESIKLKQVRIMLPEVGNEFDGKVNGMMENGLFIVLQDPFVEGVINKESMTDDQYEFQEERMLFVGRRKKRIFRIGDPVRIRVEKVDIDLRLIDFALAESTLDDEDDS
jgi:ribonuclease R